MKVLRALGRMLWDVVRHVGNFIKFVILPLVIAAAIGGINYCATERHEIVARIIIDLLFGASMLIGAALAIALLVDWFKKHYH